MKKPGSKVVTYVPSHPVRNFAIVVGLMAAALVVGNRAIALNNSSPPVADQKDVGEANPRKPSSTAGGTENPAPAGSTLTADQPPDGCTKVRLMRPNVTKPKIQISFRGPGSSVEAFKFCNPEGLIQMGAVSVIGITPDPKAGAMVSLRVGQDGVGTVNVPKTLIAGEAYQLACDIKEGKLAYALYTTQWTGSLPAALDLQDQTALKISATAAEQTCLATIPPDRRAELRR